LPSWITGLAFLGANLGALEILGMGAGAAEYGIMQAHFYWIGAIPAMCFVALFMIPFYYGSRVHSVPGYLKLRYNEATRGFNAVLFAIFMILMSGINMYAMAIVFKLLLGWSIAQSIWLSAAVVLAYVLLGGLSSSIYNEVGLVAARDLRPHRLGGWSGLQQKLGKPGFFHLGVYVRHLPLLRTRRRVGSSLPERGPIHNHHGDLAQHSHSLHRAAIREHHGLRPAPALDLLGAPVRYVPPGDVLEEGDAVGGFAALFCGTFGGLVLYGLELLGVISYGSPMAGNFWRAIWGWLICIGVTVVASLLTEPKRDEELRGLVWTLTEKKEAKEEPWYKNPWVLAALALVLAVLLNVIFF